LPKANYNTFRASRKKKKDAVTIVTSGIKRKYVQQRCAQVCYGFEICFWWVCQNCRPISSNMYIKHGVLK